MKNIILMSLFIFGILAVLEFTTPVVDARVSSRWPPTYIECIWKVLDYMDQMAANSKQQAEDIHAMREKMKAY